MQSGITASPTLHSQFRSFLTDPSLYALFITITSERLEPLLTIPSSSSDFLTSLPSLNQHLTPTRPLYILLRRHTAPHPTPLVCITYVPDAAPVRQKTLFASTRLTLIRELGAEQFGEGMFATEAADVSPEGWEKWERHLEGGDGEEVLTKEEREKEELKREEGGAVGERKMVRMQGQQGSGSAGGGMKVALGEGVIEALSGLSGGEGGGLVMLVCFSPPHCPFF